MKSFMANEHHNKLKDDLAAVLKKHGEHLSPQEILAIAAQVVGMIVALQDQRTMTPDMAMELVARNIQSGNKAAIEQSLGEVKGNG